jgi:serine protease Do
MSAGRGPFPHGNELWRVRVRSRAEPGRILGAGVLLDREHVLTCAHVAMAAAELAVDVVGLDGVPSSDAWIVDGLCVPPFANEQRGDVALLKLGVPQPEGIGAPLRRAALSWDRLVHALGYPNNPGLEMGVWARMTLAGQVGVEWLQMNRRHVGEQRVRKGFSGAGVADDETGEVLGIIVSEYTDDAAGLSWMLPVEAIITHLPLVSEWAVGDSAIDPAFDARDADLTGPVAQFAGWLARRFEGAAVLIVVGPDVVAVRKAVALSSPKTADLGPVDLALDVVGQTVEEVSRRILNRAGLGVDNARTSSERLQAGTPPMTIVATGIDEAKEPEALLGNVFTPLVESGARVVLGFRHNDSASLAMARTLAAETVAGRLDACGARITALEAGNLGAAVAELRLQLTAMRMAAAEDTAMVAERLTKFEQRIAKAERALRTANRSAAAISDHRGLLTATQARAAAGGLIEDLELAAKYRVAAEVLAADPVDEAAAHAAVRAYQDAVRRALATRERE